MVYIMLSALNAICSPESGKLKHFYQKCPWFIFVLTLQLKFCVNVFSQYLHDMLVQFVKTEQRQRSFCNRRLFLSFLEKGKAKSTWH